MNPDDTNTHPQDSNDSSAGSSAQAPDPNDDSDSPQGDSSQIVQKSAQQPDPQYTASIPVPDEAADSDLIEKEWVERAKQIVDHTKDDPHEQQRAISQMRADYLKKRYNKDVGSSEV